MKALALPLHHSPILAYYSDQYLRIIALLFRNYLDSIFLEDMCVRIVD